MIFKSISNKRPNIDGVSPIKLPVLEAKWIYTSTIEIQEGKNTDIIYHTFVNF